MSRVLKARSLAPSAGAAQPSSDAVSRAEVERLLAEARASAREEGRRQGLEAGRQEGLQQGLEQGRALGAEESLQQLGGLVGRLRESLSTLERRTLDELRDVEQRVVELALAVAERILACEVEEGRYDLRQTLSRALELARDKSEAVVYVHPSDLERLPPAEREGWTCMADTNLDPGDLVVETPTGRVISTLADQLEAVRKAIRSGEAYA
ncbi:MAG: FliH/SctL family protein [Planctomycetota bacterium]